MGTHTHNVYKHTSHIHACTQLRFAIFAVLCNSWTFSFKEFNLTIMPSLKNEKGRHMHKTYWGLLTRICHLFAYCLPSLHQRDWVGSLGSSQSGLGPFALAKTRDGILARNSQLNLFLLVETSPLISLLQDFYGLYHRLPQVQACNLFKLFYISAYPKRSDNNGDD